jgi:hypothetical protein
LQLLGSLEVSVWQVPSPTQSARGAWHWLVQDEAFIPSGQGVAPSEQRHWHTLLLQVLAVLPVDCEQSKLGFWLEQPPQLLGSLVPSVAHWPLPSQSSWPVGQFPFIWPPGQFAQLGSLHVVTPSVHMHCELTQLCDPQTVPQAPQLLGSLVMSKAQLPLLSQSPAPLGQEAVHEELLMPSGQGVIPSGQMQLHVPPEQVLAGLPVLVAQELLQVAQFAGSALRSWQPCPSPQSCWPVGQFEAPRLPLAPVQFWFASQLPGVQQSEQLPSVAVDCVPAGVQAVEAPVQSWFASQLPAVQQSEQLPSVAVDCVPAGVQAPAAAVQIWLGSQLPGVQQSWQVPSCDGWPTAMQAVLAPVQVWLASQDPGLQQSSHWPSVAVETVPAGVQVAAPPVQSLFASQLPGVQQSSHMPSAAVEGEPVAVQAQLLLASQLPGLQQSLQSPADEGEPAGVQVPVPPVQSMFASQLPGVQQSSHWPSVAVDIVPVGVQVQSWFESQALLQQSLQLPSVEVVAVPAAVQAAVLPVQIWLVSQLPAVQQSSH